MRFLIRDVLLITFFVAVGLLYFTSERKLRLLRERLASQEQANAASYSQNLKLMAERDFVQADIDRYTQVEDLAKQIESHFPTLQTKYSAIVPRDGASVALRTIPMLADRKTGENLNRTRLVIPRERAVFLKYGVAARETKKSDLMRQLLTIEAITEPLKANWVTHFDFHVNGVMFRETQESTASMERATTWEVLSDYSEAGPFEVQLQSGVSDFDWSCRLNDKGLWETRLYLNQQPLLTSVLETKVDTISSGSLLAKEQMDFAPGIRLPELFTSSRALSPSVAQVPSFFQINVWLDEASSGFAAFPGTANSAEPKR